jgi:catechol 2,3-dioxygenase-like lactoylglutathione lyase family enzyme
MGHVLINVRYCARTEQFYRDVLGFRLSDYIDTEFMGKPLHAVFLHVNRRHHSLAFASLGMPKRLHHVMLEANTIDDVGATFYRVTQESAIWATGSGPIHRAIQSTDCRLSNRPLSKDISVCRSHSPSDATRTTA